MPRSAGGRLSQERVINDDGGGNGGNMTFGCGGPFSALGTPFHADHGRSNHDWYQWMYNPLLGWNVEALKQVLERVDDHGVSRT